MYHPSVLTAPVRCPWPYPPVRQVIQKDLFMEELHILKRFDNDKLIDVVRNYKKYNYSEEVRNTAIGLLTERGYTLEELRLFGYLDNKDYDEAEKEYNAFRRNSKIAICVLILSAGILTPVYILFIILAYYNQERFYRALRKENDSSLLIVGVIFYFHLRNKMKEELHGSR